MANEKQKSENKSKEGTLSKEDYWDYVDKTEGNLKEDNDTKDED